MTDFVKDELLRVVHTLPETDPRTPEYHTLLRSIEALDSIGSTINDIIALEPCNRDCTDCAECEEEDKSKVVDFPPAPPEPHETEEPKDEEPTLTSSEVRAKLASARRAGVNVASIIKDMGVDNFTALPAGKYAELLKRIDDAGSGMD